MRWPRPAAATPWIALEQSGADVAQAAIAVAASVDQIAKSLVFRASRASAPMLVSRAAPIAVDERKVGRAHREAVGRADATREANGRASPIGGVAPVAHSEPLTILIDEVYCGGRRSGRRPAIRTRSSS